MIKETFELKLANGMHARPAGLFVKTVGPLACEVQLNYKDKSLNGKSIMALISSGLKMGDLLEITCDGEAEQEAMAAIRALFEANFNE